MDVLIIYAIIVWGLAEATIWGDHSRAPYLFAPLAAAAAAYLLAAGGVLYLEHHMLVGPVLALLLWIVRLLGQTPDFLMKITGQARVLLLWIGIFLVAAQGTYLFLTFETWWVKHTRSKGGH